MPLYSQNFDAFSAGTKLPGWSNGWVVSNVNPVSGTRGFSGSLRPDGTTSVYTGISAMADMQVTAKQVLHCDILNVPNIGVAVRVDAAFDNGYLLLLDHSPDVAVPCGRLFKRINGAFSVIGTTPFLHEFSNGDTVNTKVSIQGNKIQCKLWPGYLTEPTNWTLEVIDTSITAPGYMGLYYGLDSSPETLEVSIDDISISNPLAYYENFDGLTTGASVAGWSGGWLVSTVNPASGAKSFTSPTNNDGDSTVNTAMAAIADMEFQAVQRIVFNTSSMVGIAMGIRLDSAFQNGYLIIGGHSTNAGKVSFNLLKCVSGTFSLIVGVEIATLTSGVSTNMKFRCQGTSLNFKAWPVGTTEPDWQITTTDSSISAAGYVGLYYGLDGATPGTVVTIDNVSVTNLAATPLYSENFDALTAGATIANWSNGWAVTNTTPVSGTKAFTLPLRRDGQVSVYTGMPPIADMDVTASQIINFDTSTAPNIGIIFRSDAKFNNGYLILCDRSVTSGNVNLVLFKKVSGIITLLSTTPVTGLTTGIAITTRVQISGTAIRVRMWNNSGSEPSSWHVNTTDSSISATGYMGLYYALDGAAIGTEISIDNIIITNLGVLAVTAAANNAAIVYSPYNWNIASQIATTVNAGAYFYTKFTGTSCILSFDIGNMASPYSQIWYRIDGIGGWAKAEVAENINCLMPTDTTSYQQHLLEVVVKSTSETLARWTNSATAVKFLGVVLDNGATVALPGKRLLNVLIFADSIGEGVRTVNSTATLDTDRNDVMQTWSFNQQEQLGAEVGIVGFGGQGWNVTGSGGVPSLPNAFNFLFAGVSRVFTPAPDLVVINMGTNDGANNVVTQIVSFLNSILPLVSCRIVLLVPFNGSQAANLATAVGQCNQPYRVTLLQTAGIYNNAYSSDTTHPYGFTSLIDIGPAIGQLLKGTLSPVLNFAF